MSFLFGRNRQKTPQDLVRAVRESISRMDVHLERRRVSLLLPLLSGIMIASIGGLWHLLKVVVIMVSCRHPKMPHGYSLRWRLSCKEMQVRSCHSLPVWFRIRLPCFLRNSATDMYKIETDPIPDQVQMLAQEVYTIDLLPLLANNMARLDFEVGILI